MKTKTAVHYRRGHGNQECGNCSMFREPHRCTAVTGYIRFSDLCDLFERKYADGGAVDYTTPLAGDDIDDFERWKELFAPRDSGYDYDLPGAYKAGLTPDVATGHFDDRFKKPNHPTFSTYSQYAKDRPDLAGTWEGDQYIPPVTAHYATGGKVKAFTVPPDVIKKLGAGDQLKGFAVLRDAFGIEPGEPLGRIPADTIAAIGGRQVLQKFIARVRAGKRKIAIATDGEFDAVAARTEKRH